MSALNKDDPEPPKWIDNEFILEVLKNCESDQPLEIKDVKFSPGSEKGDHYASAMFRAVVNFKTAAGTASTRSMIIKTLPELGSVRGNMLAKTKVFETEIGIYTEIIPKMERLLKKYGDETKLAPRPLYCSLSPRKVIVLEDLCALGYSTVRGRFLNMVETKQMLLLLAKWHAISFKLATENDESVKAYDQGIFNHPRAETAAFLNRGVKNICDVLLTLEGFEKYAEKLQGVKKNLLRNCERTFNAYKNGDTRSLMVLNHGDFHMKNAMFKNSEEKLEDVKLVDFQLCTYSPAIIDVTYLLMNPELRLKHREELIYFYFQNLLDTLQKIEYTGKMPTLADFNMDMIRNADFEIFVLSCFLPMWINRMYPMETIDMEKIFKSPDHLAAIYRHPKYVKELKKILPKLLYKATLTGAQKKNNKKKS